MENKEYTKEEIETITKSILEDYENPLFKLPLEEQKNFCKQAKDYYTSEIDKSLNKDYTEFWSKV